jgi:hypothetical protein
MTDAIPGAVSGTVLLADYANADSGKLNIIGGGATVLRIVPPGITSPFTVVVRLVSPLPLDEAVAVEVVLVDDNGDPVLGPGPVPGELVPIRVGQNVPFEKPVVAGVSLPKGAIPSAALIVVGFPGGVPLIPNRSYTWRVQVDHDVIASTSFYVIGAPEAPVYG